jgi:oxygen-independent coproporphyrinogen-3 oxidase
MTRLATRWDSREDYTPFLDDAIGKLAEPAADGLVELDATGCRVTERGRGFLRNICMAFDARLARRMPDKMLFSRTV